VIKSIVLTAAYLGCSWAATRPEEGTPTATVQHLFDAMSLKDGSAAKALFTTEATLVAIAPDGKITSTPVEKWTERLAASKDTWLERIWDPQVLEQGSLAVVWAPYDFHMNGKFSHCGVDSVSLIKTEAGWRISALSFTRQTSGCPSSPLGPPKPDH
jgi:hypothetical protein